MISSGCRPNIAGRDDDAWLQGSGRGGLTACGHSLCFSLPLSLLIALHSALLLLMMMMTMTMMLLHPVNTVFSLTFFE